MICEKERERKGQERKQFDEKLLLIVISSNFEKSILPTVEFKTFSLPD